MNLYFIAKQDGEFSFDWFACANSQDEAISLWQEDDYIQETLGEDAYPDAVFFVPAIPQLDHILKGPHLLDWHIDVHTKRT